MLSGGERRVRRPPEPAGSSESFPVRPPGVRTLDEIESKALVAAAGIRTTPPSLARTAAEAADVATRLGFPVVLKIASPAVSHKSDVGGVRLDLRCADDVRAAFAEITAACRAARPEAPIDGVTVQSMAPPGGVELIVGARRDPLFGPVILFGLGGIWVEALDDVSCRLAPLSAGDAHAMLLELRGSAVLRGGRGRAGLDLGAIEQVLLSLSDLMLRRPDIAEIDLNPLLAYAEGAIAADARVALDEPPAAASDVDRRSRAAQLDRAFDAKVVAVIGDKAMNGFLWLRALRNFEGRLYSVQIDPNEIPAIEAMGVRNVKSLAEIGEPVDYAILAVPRQVVTRVLADCAAARVGAVTAFTAGFSETGEAEGARLEAEIAALVAGAEYAFIGPNCMGLANPRRGLCNFPGEPSGAAAAGGVSFLGQSGTHTIAFCMRAAGQGLGVHKAVSFGNGVQLDAADLLAYFGDDPSTEVVAGYVEGVRRGRHFFEVLRRTARRKPVVLWKGGRSEAGHRAILSHTAALATSNAVWDGMLRQAGAIGVDTLDELTDVVRLVGSGKRARGRRSGLIAMTGGPSVALTDAFCAAGLEVPVLDGASYGRLAEFFNVIGGSLRNPLDAGSTIAMGFRSDNLRRLLDVLDGDGGIDLIAIDVGTALSVDRWKEFPEALNAMLATLAEFARATPKPCVAILEPAHRDAEVAELRARFTSAGVVAMSSAPRAARALAKAVSYWAGS